MKLIAQMDMTKLEIETYIKLFEDHVEIKKPGPGGSTKKYLERSIPLSDIKRVDVKPAGGFLSTGYIQFVVKDEKERKGGFLRQQKPEHITCGIKWLEMKNIGAQIRQALK